LRDEIIPARKSAKTNYPTVVLQPFIEDSLVLRSDLDGAGQ
jgi:hypothetical protein